MGQRAMEVRRVVEAAITVVSFLGREACVALRYYWWGPP